MACTVRPARLSLVEELLQPELAVPTHDPISVLHVQPDHVGTAVFGPQITSTILFGPSEDEPASTEVEAVAGPKPEPAFPGPREDRPDTRLLYSNTTGVGEVQQGRFLAWKSFFGFRLATDLPKDLRKKGTPQQHQHPSGYLSRIPATSSLRSLIGSSTENNSTPTTTSIQAVSLASSSTSIDSHRALAPKSSSTVYLLDRNRDIYIGHLQDVPVPNVLNELWNRVIRERLVIDIGSVSQSIPGSLPQWKLTLEPVFCMAGKSDGSTGLVELFPTILIRCGSKRLRRAVEKAITTLEYLQDFSEGRTLVIGNAPRPASRQASMEISNPDRADFEHTEIRTMHLDTPSGCGIPLACMIRDSTRMRLSVVGGLIRVDDTIYGLTTAHSVIELDCHNGLSTYSSSDSDSDDSSASENSSSSTENTSTASSQEVIPNRARRYTAATVRDDLHRFNDPATLKSYSYGSKRLPDVNTNAYAVSEGSDFALINLGQTYHRLPNMYSGPTEQYITKVPSVDTHFGLVSIVCSPGDVRPAYLLEDDHLFLTGATVFSTKKLQTQMPLEQGLSGAWVVSGDQLLGMIIAVYDDEPYAHMLEMTKVISDIRALMSTEDRIPQVALVEPPCLASATAIEPLRKPLHDMALVPPLSYIEAEERGKTNWEHKTRPKWSFVQEYLKENLTVVGTRNRDAERFCNPAYKSTRSQLVLGAILTARFCTRLDEAMLPFLLRDVTDEFASLGHLGLYTGLHYLLVYICRSSFDVVLRHRQIRWLIMLALSACIAGQLCSGLATNTWIFLLGRCLFACGTAGISSIVLSLDYNRVAGFTWCSVQRANAVLNCVALLLGTLTASAVVGSGPTPYWRICFSLNVALLCVTVLVLAVNLNNQILRGTVLYADYGIIDVTFGIYKVGCVSAMIAASVLTWTKLGKPEVIVAIAVLLFGFVFFKQTYEMTLRSFLEWTVLAKFRSRLGSMLGKSASRARSWPHSLQLSIIECYTGMVHVNYALIMLFLPIAIQNATKYTRTSGWIYSITLLPTVVCILLIQPRRNLHVSLTVPLSLALVAVSSLFIAHMFSTNAFAIGPFVILELLIGIGIGLSVSLLSSEDDMCTKSELFHAAGAALAQAAFLSRIFRNNADLFDDNAISMTDAKTKLGDKFVRAMGMGFVGSMILGGFFAVLFGIPHLISEIWQRRIKALQRGSPRDVELEDYIFTAQTTADLSRKRERGESVSAVDSQATLYSLLSSTAGEGRSASKTDV